MASGIDNAKSLVLTVEAFREALKQDRKLKRIKNGLKDLEKG